MTVWRYLNTPSNFDGRDLARLGHIASRVEGAGMDWEAAEIRAFIEKSRPLHTWYGEALNQGWHTLGGLLVVCLMAAGFDLAFGELPAKLWLLLLAIPPYGVLIEWWVQGWKGGDSWFDCYMWACGALTPVLYLSEVPDGHLDRHPEWLALMLAVWAVPLFLRVRKRLRG